MNLGGACVESNNFFCILERVDGINGEISMNLNKCTLYTIVFLIRLKGRSARVNEVLMF